MEKSEKSKNQTDEAIKKAKDAYDAAAKIVETLEDFDNILQENKRKADEQMAIKAETKTNLEASNELSKKFGENLNEAKQNLNDASKKATDASINLNLVKNVGLYSHYILFLRILF